MDNYEFTDDFIREYLQTQLSYYAEPFVEKKAQMEIQNDIQQEFNELLGEITKDEQQIKVLIELCAFMLDKTQQENQRFEDEARAYEEHILQMQEKLDFESKTQKQFQKMYHEQLAKIKENLEVITKLENELTDKENTIMILQQNTNSARQRSVAPREDIEFLQNVKIIDDQKLLIQKQKQELNAIKDKVDYYQQQYSRQTAEIEDALNENSVLKLEKLRFESKLKTLEQEVQRLNQQVVEQDTSILNSNEIIQNLRRQIYEMQNTSAVKESEPNSLTTSQICPSKSIYNPLSAEIPEISSYRPSVQSKYAKGPCIIEENEEDSQLHSKKPSLMPQQREAGQIDIKKLEEKLQRLATPSQTPRQQTAITPRTQMPKVVQDMRDVRACRLKEKLLQSGIICNSNMTSPRPVDMQPVTKRMELLIDSVQEEGDCDFYYEQKVKAPILTTPQFKNTPKIPTLSLNKGQQSQQTSSTYSTQQQQQQQQQPKDIYKQFNQVNEAFFQDIKLDQINILPPPPQNNRTQRQSSLFQTSLNPKRDPYKEFFDLLCQCVKLNSIYFNEIVYIDTTDYYKQMQKLGIPFNQWETWIKNELESQVIE